MYRVYFERGEEKVNVKFTMSESAAWMFCREHMHRWADNGRCRRLVYEPV